MDANRFDTIAKFFAQRKLSRRQALREGGVGLAAGALAMTGGGGGVAAVAQGASDATPDVTPDDRRGPTMLFLQSFRAGSIAPKPGEDGRFTLTLEQGLGQTIYFSDRPDRIVGATPTPRFLAGLGFPDDNPPNAALLVDSGADDTDIVVIELFAPQYDDATHTATYDVEVLQQWERTAAGFASQPTDLAQLHPTFGAAHLFIDDCPRSHIYCSTGYQGLGGTLVGHVPNRSSDDSCYSPKTGLCMPCHPWIEDMTQLAAYWTEQCNTQVSGCNGNCIPYYFCKSLEDPDPFGGAVCELELG